MRMSNKQFNTLLLVVTTAYIIFSAWILTAANAPFLVRFGFGAWIGGTAFQLRAR